MKTFSPESLYVTAQPISRYSFGAKAFSQMNNSMVVKIVTVATVTVGGMDAAVEPIGIYSRRVTGETVAMYTAQYPIQPPCFEVNSF